MLPKELVFEVSVQCLLPVASLFAESGADYANCCWCTSFIILDPPNTPSISTSVDLLLR